MPKNELVATVRLNDRVTAGFRKITSVATKATKKMIAGFKRVARSLLSLKGIVTAFIAGAAVKGLLNAFVEQEKAVVGFNDALRRGAKFTGQYANQMGELASELQSVGIFGDEVILANTKLLAQTKAIGQDVLPRAITASTDLAAALGIDLGTAARLVTNAAVGMTSTFTRYGIKISEAATKSGDFETILREIEKSVGGANRALRESSFGGLAAISNAFGDLKEAAGKAIAAIIKSGLGDFLRTTFKVLTEDLDKVSESFGSAEGGAKSASTVIVSTLKGVALAAAAVGDAIELALKPIGILREGRRSIESIQIQSVIGELETALEGASKKGEEFGVVLRKAMPQFNATADALVANAVGAEMSQTQTIQLRDALSSLLVKSGEEKAILDELAAKRATEGTLLERTTALFIEVEARMQAASDAGRDFGAVGDDVAWVGELNNDLNETDIVSGEASKALEKLARDMDRLAEQKRFEKQLPKIRAWNRKVEKAQAERIKRQLQAEADAVETLVGFHTDGLDVMLTVTQGFATAIVDFTSQVIDKAFEGQIQSIKDVGKIAQDVLKSLLKAVIQQLVQLAITAATTKAVTGSFAQGGVVQGSFQPIATSAATGGVFKGEQLVRIADNPSGVEAAVPLPDGRRIPVDVRGGGDLGGGATEVNLSINAIDSQDVARVLTSPEGQDSLRRTMADSMDRSQEFRTKMRGNL